MSPASCPDCDGPSARPLRVLAVDDELPVLEEIVYLLGADPRVGTAEGAQDSTEALRLLHRAADADRPVDAVFLDIKMPGLNGMELARVLTRFASPPALVFVTADDQSAVEAFELKALDYVLKPIRPQRLSEALHRVAHKVLASSVHVPAQQAAESPAVTPDDVIPVELGGVTRFLRLSDVRYAEAQGDYARLHTASGSYLVRTPLTGLEERWRDAGFVRIHRSHLISLAHVEELRLDGGQMSVKIGGATLTVSRRHTPQLRDLLVKRARPHAVRAGK
ncbi:LytR/AlgR family response regulator transcription factor [Kutzneria sp. CA-103260]|uniref:LytR/AlgR family response regulator transcription factor n=1 Tax=Kutzneria sp. CA-103260 TaxID=2802641 RepID=UPI001BAC6D26|nr:LytTR family DNA-binding domain-containing protein [Kutzneria sp. CA-103260]QUQ65094.1 regulatory protein [Kutzneria sp. CA-103260]